MRRYSELIFLSNSNT